MYYVFVYIQFVLLTPILIRLAKSEYRFIGWIIAPVSILIFKYAGLFFDVEYHRYISLFWSDACLGWFTFYYLGLLLGDQIITIRRRSVKSLCVYYGASLISQMLEGYLFLLHGDSNCGTQLKLSSLLSSTIFLMIIHTVLQNGGFRNRCSSLYDFFIFIGDYSFGIYLCHMAVILVLSQLPLIDVIPFPINSFMVVLLSLICCSVGRRICGPKISGWLGLR